MTPVDRARQSILAASADPARLAAVLDPVATAAADVDDVCQDVLVAVAENVGSYRGEARFTTWLSQVARYKAVAGTCCSVRTPSQAPSPPPPGHRGLAVAGRGSAGTGAPPD